MVDCKTTLQRLDLYHFKLNEVDEPIKDHFENCDNCQQIAQNRQAFDRSLKAALTDVPIPVNLEARLLAAAQLEQEQSAAKVSPLKSPKHSRSRLLLKSLLVLVPCILVGAMLLQVDFSGPSKLDYHDKFVETSIEVFSEEVSDQAAPFFDASFNLATVDSQLSRIRSSEIFGGDLDSDGEQDIAGYRFNHSSAKGVLLVIPNDKLVETPAANFPSSTSGREFVWTNGKVTYFCYIESGSSSALFDALYSPA